MQNEENRMAKTATLDREWVYKDSITQSELPEIPDWPLLPIKGIYWAAVHATSYVERESVTGTSTLPRSISQQTHTGASL